MDAEKERQLLLAEYRNLAKILKDSGQEVPDWDPETLTNTELAAAVATFRRLARTPRS